MRTHRDKNVLGYRLSGIIIDKDTILERWSEYNGKLYGDEGGEKNFDGCPIPKDEV